MNEKEIFIAVLTNARQVLKSEEIWNIFHILRMHVPVATSLEYCCILSGQVALI
jgi:hypothetical protein